MAGSNMSSRQSPLKSETDTALDVLRRALERYKAQQQNIYDIATLPDPPIVSRGGFGWSEAYQRVLELRNTNRLLERKLKKATDTRNEEPDEVDSIPAVILSDPDVPG